MSQSPTKAPMSTNARAVLVAAFAVAAVLIIGGLGYDAHVTRQFSDCVPDVSEWTTWNGSCEAPSRGGLLVAAFGAVILVGAGAAAFVLRKPTR